MKYFYGEDVKLSVEPNEFDKNTEKELLQYAVGGLLYMPASNDKIAQKIISGEYGFIKSMVLDLEDSLGDDLVNFGKLSIKNTINEISAAVAEGKLNIKDVPLIFIRIRELGQMSETLSIMRENIKYITGFNIPKFDKKCCEQYINEFKEVRDAAWNMLNGQSKLYIMPIIENTSAMYRQLRMDNLLYINNALRTISDNVLNIRVGGADFCSIFGIRRKITETIEDIGVVRSVFADIINVFGKNYVVSGPVWEYFGKEVNEESQWVIGLRRELKADMLNGFIGKTSIHPNQLGIIQDSLIVDYIDYQDALNILGMNTNMIGVKKSTNDGMGNFRMNEVKTHSNWAKKTIALATIYGVKQQQ